MNFSFKFGMIAMLFCAPLSAKAAAPTVLKCSVGPTVFNYTIVLPREVATGHEVRVFRAELGAAGITSKYYTLGFKKDLSPINGSIESFQGASSVGVFDLTINSKGKWVVKKGAVAKELDLLPDTVWGPAFSFYAKARLLSAPLNVDTKINNLDIENGELLYTPATLRRTEQDKVVGISLKMGAATSVSNFEKNGALTSVQVTIPPDIKVNCSKAELSEARQSEFVFDKARFDKFFSESAKVVESAKPAAAIAAPAPTKTVPAAAVPAKPAAAKDPKSGQK